MYNFNGDHGFSGWNFSRVYSSTFERYLYIITEVKLLLKTDFFLKCELI